MSFLCKDRNCHSSWRNSEQNKCSSMSTQASRGRIGYVVVMPLEEVFLPHSTRRRSLGRPRRHWWNYVFWAGLGIPWCLELEVCRTKHHVHQHFFSINKGTLYPLLRHWKPISVQSFCRGKCLFNIHSTVELFNFHSSTKSKHCLASQSCSFKIFSV